MRAIGNIFWLGTKEIRSFLRDWVLVALVIYAFSIAVIAQAQSNSQELHNASIAYVDEDQSELSRRIVRAFLPPYFQTPQPITERDIIPLMNAGRYTFIIDIPPNFEKYVLGRRNPAIQLNIDATSHQWSPEKIPRRSSRPHCRQKCLPTGHIFALGCLSCLAETSRKAAKYWIDSVACRCS